MENSRDDFRPFGQQCTLVIEGYDDDANKSDFHTAIANFLSAPPEVLKAATPFVHQYYEDMNSNGDPDDPEYVSIETPEDVWKHVQLGFEPMPPWYWGRLSFMTMSKPPTSAPIRRMATGSMSKPL